MSNQMPKKCKFCGSEDTAFKLAANGQIFVRCHSCGRLYNISEAVADVTSSSAKESDETTTAEQYQIDVTEAPKEMKKFWDKKIEKTDEGVAITFTADEESDEADEVYDATNCKYRLPCGICTQTKEKCIVANIIATYAKKGKNK